MEFISNLYKGLIDTVFENRKDTNNINKVMINYLVSSLLWKVF
jgi:hypothetical protein